MCGGQLVKVHVQGKGSRCDGELTVDDDELRVVMGDDSGLTRTGLNSTDAHPHRPELMHTRMGLSSTETPV